MVVTRRTTSSNRRHPQDAVIFAQHRFGPCGPFDHDHAVADAGLLLTGTLVKHLGLEAFTDEAVAVGYRPGRKLATRVQTMVAGGDCVDA